MLRRIILSLIVGLLAISIFFSPYTFSMGDSLEKAISHLLKYVEESGCAYIRNDKKYSSNEAAEHIKKKYDHFKDEIVTPERFIELCATKSLVSGKPYFVRCGRNDKIPSAAWLLAELERYRSRIVEK